MSLTDQLDAQGAFQVAAQFVPGGALIGSIVGAISMLTDSGPAASLDVDPYAPGNIGYGLPIPLAERSARLGVYPLEGFTTPLAGAYGTDLSLLPSGAHYSVERARYHITKQAQRRGGAHRLIGSAVLVDRRVNALSPPTWERVEIGTGERSWPARLHPWHVDDLLDWIDETRARMESMSADAEPFFPWSDLRTWGEPGGGAEQTWHERVPLSTNLFPYYSSPPLGNRGLFARTSLADWTARTTPESAEAGAEWDARLAQRIAAHEADVAAWRAWKLEQQASAQLEAQLAAYHAAAVEAYASGLLADPETGALALEQLPPPPVVAPSLPAPSLISNVPVATSSAGAAAGPPSSRNLAVALGSALAVALLLR